MKVTIIRKQIKPIIDAENNFKKEEHILSLLRCLKHPNIIQLLTAYTIQQTHNFLFPLADGDLKHLLYQEHRPPGFQTENEIFQALYELASAIEAVHDYFSDTFEVRRIGCHYDLTPKNILYHSGKLILSDFGLSRLSDETEGSKSLYKNGGGEYWAPESTSVQESFKKLPVGRSSDMWSFGCVMSELLTLIQEGPTGVQNFSTARIVVLAEYWECKAFHEGARPNGKVTQWLSRLSDKPNITKAQRKILALIRDLLQHDPDARPKAQSTTLTLWHIAQSEPYQMIDLAFQPLLPESPSFDVCIEYQRFCIWGEVSGFVDLGRVFRPNDPVVSRSFGDMQLVRECLFKLRQEVHKLSEVLKVNGPKPYRICFHLQKMVDTLWNTQSLAVRGDMMQTLENRLLSTEDIAQLRCIEAAFPGADDDNASNGPTRGITPIAYRRIGLLAAVKQLALALNNRMQSPGNMLIDETQIKKPLKEFHWHKVGIAQIAEGSESQVLIELLRHDGSWAERMDELVQRVEDIASFRAPVSTRNAFPVLTCAGYYHDLAKQAFSIVYCFPPRQLNPLVSIPEIERPMSLRDIISKIKSRTQRPSLNQVFNTAFKLVSVVLTMHKTSWFHKNISSYNIIFFPDRFTSIADAMTSPYFIGFNYSRLNLETAFTQGPDQQQLEYQHPEYLLGRRRFCQEYEYHSVGLVLLELGLWFPLEAITKEIQGSPTEMVQALLRRHVPKLKTYMGSAYEEAVMACLNGDLGVSADPLEVREAFERKVLLKIDPQTSVLRI